jgi:hypothetical protein
MLNKKSLLTLQGERKNCLRIAKPFVYPPLCTAKKSVCLTTLIERVHSANQMSHNKWRISYLFMTFEGADMVALWQLCYVASLSFALKMSAKFTLHVREFFLPLILIHPNSSIE